MNQITFDEDNVITVHGIQGEKGEEGIQGEKGDKGKQGEKGDKGERGFKGEKGDEGKDGTDGSPDSPEDIANKLNTLNDILEIKVIKGHKEFLQPVEKRLGDLEKSNTLKPTGVIDQRWGGRGSGIKSVSHDTTLTGDGTPSSPLSVVSSGSSGYQVPTGLCNSSNQTFVFATAPSAIEVDGSVYTQQTNDGGTINWDIVGTTVTFRLLTPNYSCHGLA